MPAMRICLEAILMHTRASQVINPPVVQVWTAMKPAAARAISACVPVTDRVTCPPLWIHPTHRAQQRSAGHRLARPLRFGAPHKQVPPVVN